MTNEEELKECGRAVEAVGDASSEEGTFDLKLGFVVEGV